MARVATEFPGDPGGNAAGRFGMHLRTRTRRRRCAISTSTSTYSLVRAVCRIPMTREPSLSYLGFQSRGSDPLLSILFSVQWIPPRGSIRQLTCKTVMGCLSQNRYATSFLVRIMVPSVKQGGFLPSSIADLRRTNFAHRLTK